MQFAVIKVNSCDSYPRKAGDTIARVLTTCSILSVISMKR